MTARPTEERRFFLPIATVLLVAMLGVLGYQRFHKKSVTPAAQAVVQPPPGSDLDALMPYTRPVAESLRTAVGVAGLVTLPRDPFAGNDVRTAASEPPRASEETAATIEPADTTPVPKWNVTAILITSSRKAAVINDEVVTLGGRLPGGGQLTAVEPDHVVLTDTRGGRRTVKLDGSGL